MEFFKEDKEKPLLDRSLVNSHEAEEIALSSIPGIQSLSDDIKKSRITALQYDSSGNNLDISNQLCGQINSLTLTNDELAQLENEINQIRSNAEAQREECVRKTSRCHYLTALLLLGIPTITLAISAARGNRGATLAGDVADSSIPGLFSSCGSCMMESIKKSTVREIKDSAQIQINEYINNFIRQKLSPQHELRM